jgi:hypothetical protein
MIIVYGTRCYGRADVIEGLGHVTCRFVHVMFIPLVPIETLFVDDGDHGIKLPFSFKAAASGWLRGGAILTGLGLLAGAVAGFADGEPLLGGVSFVVAVLAFAAFPLFGMLFGNCSPLRRTEIMSLLGMPVQMPAYDAMAAMPGMPAYGGAGYAPGYGHGQAPPQPHPHGHWPQPQHPGLPPPAGGFGQPPAYGAPPAAYGHAPPAYGAPQHYGPPQPHAAPPAFGPPPGFGPPGYDPSRRHNP